MIQPSVRAFINELNHQPTFNSQNSIQTEMHGRGRVNQYVMSGNSGSYPSEARRDFQAVGFPTPYVDVSTGGKVSRSKKANKWTDYAEDTAYKALNLADSASRIGGKVSRSKKAKKWTDYAEDTAYKALNLADSASRIGGKISRSKKAKKWTKYAEDTAYKALNLADSASRIGGVRSGGARSGGARSARSAIVKKVMQERGVNLPTASSIVKREELY